MYTQHKSPSPVHTNIQYFKTMYTRPFTSTNKIYKKPKSQYNITGKPLPQDKTTTPAYTKSTLTLWSEETCENLKYL